MKRKFQSTPPCGVNRDSNLHHPDGMFQSTPRAGVNGRGGGRHFPKLVNPHPRAGVNPAVRHGESKEDACFNPHPRFVGNGKGIIKPLRGFNVSIHPRGVIRPSANGYSRRIVSIHTPVRGELLAFHNQIFYGI